MSSIEPTSRRKFLKNSTLLTAAASVGLGAPVFAAPTNVVRVRQWGAKPDLTSFGVVVVPRQKKVFLTFQAINDAEDQGVAVVTLYRCVDWQFRCAGDEMFASHPVDLEELGVCETYEVIRSTWAEDWMTEIKQTKPRLRHYVFTFSGVVPGVCEGGQNFECVATRLDVDFFPSFLEAKAYIDSVEAE